MKTEAIYSLDLVGRDLTRRLNAPIKSVTFYAHLLVAVLLGGGAGVWYSIYQNGLEMQPLAAALLTYFPALVAAALIDFTHERQPYLRSFGLIAAGVFLTIFLIAATRTPYWQCAWALGGTIMSVLFWWAANGEKSCFKDIDYEDSQGGDLKKPLLSTNDPTWKK